MRVFIGSSSEARRYVDFTETVLKAHDLEAVPWTDKRLWPGGKYLLDSLFNIVENTDGAILFMSPDDRT